MTTEDSRIGRAFRDFDARAESVPEPAIAETWEAIRMTNVGAVAAWSANQGMRVFPVHGIISPGPTEAEARCTCGTPCESPGKHPVMTGWQDTATTDHDVINEWFANGRNWNYGIALDGRHWTATELDPYDGGRLRALREIVGELGPISTSGRGHHVWFKGTNLRNGTKIGLGMTVRAAGYYVVGPGSTHYTGRRYGRRTYGFDRLGDRPDLVVATSGFGSPVHAKGSSLVVPKRIPAEIFDGEGRWRVLQSVAGTMVSRGLTEATVLLAVRAVNHNQCRPPKNDDNVVRLVRWVIEHDGATKGCKEDDFDPRPVTGPMKVAEIKNSLDGEELANEALAGAEKILEGGGNDGHRAPGQEVGDPPAGGAGGRPTDPGAGGTGEGAREGAGEGPGVEPLAGEVKGYRVFWVRGDALYSYAMAGAWTPGTNTAHCPRARAPSTPKHKPAKRTTWVNNDGKLKQITLEDDDESDEPTHGLIPSNNCSCGFWVFKSAERARAQFASELRRPRSSRYGDFDGDDELVMAEVAGWGGAVEGRDGWRFEKAKVVGLITDAPHRFRAVLDRYEIPALQSVGLAPWLRNFEARPLAEVLDALEDYIAKYVVLTAEQRCAIVLWTAHTWAVDAAQVSPYLSVTSAVMRSGKSQLVGTLRHVVAEPWVAIQPSEAVLFRRIDQLRPTLFLDEADTLFHSKDDRHEPLRALLNAGNRTRDDGAAVSPGGPEGRLRNPRLRGLLSQAARRDRAPPCDGRGPGYPDTDGAETPERRDRAQSAEAGDGRRDGAPAAARALGCVGGGRQAKGGSAGSAGGAQRPRTGFVGSARRDRGRCWCRLAGARPRGGGRSSSRLRGRSGPQGAAPKGHARRIPRARSRACPDRVPDQGARREGPVGRLVG